ncbi:MAG: hypothetical protein PHE09_11430, partial [Oscillospiraceae bacterium]|nr:hypothetical protein [Oscillospiraceae bacterium]
TRVCGQADKNVQLQARPRGLIGVRRDFNLLLHPIVIRRLTIYFQMEFQHFSIQKQTPLHFCKGVKISRP